MPEERAEGGCQRDMVEKAEVGLMQGERKMGERERGTEEKKKREEKV